MEAEQKSRSKWVLNMGGKSLFALIPALVATYFSFREAKLQSDIEIARINAKAGAGYEALVDAVKVLEVERVALTEESKRLAAYVSRLENRVDGLLVRSVRGSGPPSGTSQGRRTESAAVRSVARAIEAHPPEPSPFAPSESPVSGAAPAAGVPTSGVPSEPDKLFKSAPKPLKLPRTLDDALRAASK